MNGEPITKNCKLIRRQRGASAIEFALMLPPFILIVFSMTSYVMAFLYWQTLNTLSAESARTVVSVYSSSTNPALVQARIDPLLESSWIPRDQISYCDALTPNAGVLSVCLEASWPLQFTMLGISVPPAATTLRSISSVLVEP